MSLSLPFLLDAPKNGTISSTEKPDSSPVNYQDDIDQPPSYPYSFQPPYQHGLPIYYYPSGYEPTAAMYTQPYNMMPSNLQSCIPIGPIMWTNSNGNFGNSGGGGGGGANGCDSENGSYVCANQASSSTDNNSYFISGTPFSPYNCNGGSNGCIPATGTIILVLFIFVCFVFSLL